VWRTIGVIALVLAAGACSGGDDAPAMSGAGTTASTAPTPTFTGDGSAFCDAMLGIGQVGGDAGATPNEVLADNEALAVLLDEAQANTPEDAPPDFDALLDDYRAASLAIVEARGDADAAFAALQRDSPDVVKRLGSSTSHAAAYAFLVTRCGINAP